MFSKDAKEARKKRLAADINRGYFDDLSEFKKKGGRVFEPSPKLISVGKARPFPELVCWTSDGLKELYPPPEATVAYAHRLETEARAAPKGAVAKDQAEGASDLPSSSPPPSSPSPAHLIPSATLIAAAIRDGSQDALEAWTVPFSTAFSFDPKAVVVELAVVDSALMSLPPLRGMLLRSSAKSSDKYPGAVRYLTHFGAPEDLRNGLGMTNKYAGYLYLLDDKSRIRWRASGPPHDDQELETMLDCARELLGKPKRRKEP